MAQMKVPQSNSKQPKSEKRKADKMCEEDINAIDQVIASDNAEEKIELHQSLDGKYQACIEGWGRSMYNYNLNCGFDYNYLGEEAATHNLKQMRALIEGYKLGLNKVIKKQDNSTKVNVNVQNQNNINIDACFDLSRNQIKEMDALDQEETEAVLDKIDELEKIIKEETTRKSKWEKIKPIIQFAMGKGIDVALAILTPIVQTGLM